MAQQYDNTNQGPAWAVWAAEGYCDWNGEKWSCLVTYSEPREAGKPPIASIRLHQEDTRQYVRVKLYPPNSDTSRAWLSGHTDEWWVNVYQADESRRTERTPDIKIVFKKREPKQGAAPAPAQSRPAAKPVPQKPSAPHAPPATTAGNAKNNIPF
jgi:hypothetical protein